MADLQEYEAKRHAGKTPEPLKTKRRRKRGAPIFVVQRHSARALHYDLRLERDGALMSWALPRGVPLRGGERSLAVHVEDHPLEYATFAGDIPAGEYGGGWVEVWDHGTYEVLKERPDGTLTVILHGERLNGEWALVPAKLDGQERNWLIIRADKLGALGKAQAHEPMLAKPAKRLPSGSDWAFEIAWDGTRALSPMEGARARFEHAGGKKLDARCKQLLARMPRAIRASECVLDGVIWDLDEGVAYLAFDLLELDGVPLARRAVGAPSHAARGVARRPRRRGAPLEGLRRRRGPARSRPSPEPRRRGQTPRLPLPRRRRQRRLAPAGVAAAGAIAVQLRGLARSRVPLATTGTNAIPGSDPQIAGQTPVLRSWRQAQATGSTRARAARRCRRAC